MKRILWLIALFIFKGATAQVILHTSADSPEEIEYGTVVLKENDSLIEAYINNVNPNAVRYLVNNYEDAENIQWIIDESSITAEFNQGDKKILLTYDKRGVLLSTRKTYPEKSLDPLIAKYAKKTAGKTYSINLVTEIIKSDQTTYEISLENQSNLCIVRIRENKLKGFEKPKLVNVIKKG